jgi:hypothetical protein
MDPGQIFNFLQGTTVPGAEEIVGNLLATADQMRLTGSGRGAPQFYGLAARAAIQARDNPVAFVAANFNGARLSPSTQIQQLDYLKKNNYDISKLNQDIVNRTNLTNQILSQGTTGRWTGQGFGGPENNAWEMAGLLAGAGISDIRQFGQLPDGGYGNKETGQAINPNYDRAGGQIFAGTYKGKDSTGFGVQFGPDGTPYFYTQQGASTSSMGEVMPIISLGLTFFAPGIGTAIGTALGATGTAAAVLGSAIVQGTLSELSGGDFLEGAIKGAVTAGVAPAVANTVGSAVADVMADSAIKNVIVNAVASSASSAVTAALTGGDVESAALTGALAGAGGSVGRELGIASEYGTTPFSEQTQLLAGQEAGLGGAGSIGSSLGQAAGAIAGGVDPAQALLTSLSRIEAESRAATPTSGSETTAEAPVSPPPGAEITTAPPPETGQITDTGVMDGVAGTIPEITPPSTQEIPIPDQISQELGGIQEGIATTIPEQDQQVIDLITQPPEVTIPGVQEGIATTIPEGLAPLDEIPELAPPDMGVQEGIVETIPEDLGLQGGIVETIPEDLGLQGGIVETIPEDLGEDPLLGLSDAEVGLGEQEAIDRQALEELSSAEVGLGEQEAIDRQALEELSSAEVGLGEQEAIDAIPPQIETTPYIRDTYISGGRRKQPTFGPTVTTLGQALAAPLFPSAPVSGLTSYRGAGEIEGQKTGKPRKNVWNEASLRLKDALGL